MRDPQIGHEYQAILVAEKVACHFLGMNSVLHSISTNYLTECGEVYMNNNGKNIQGENSREGNTCKWEDPVTTSSNPGMFEVLTVQEMVDVKAFLVREGIVSAISGKPTLKDNYIYGMALYPPPKAAAIEVSKLNLLQKQIDLSINKEEPSQTPF